MKRKKNLTIDEIEFELKDVEVFKIPDTKTRLDTIQNYFFPRLEILLRESLELVKEIYGINPYEQMTFVYTPSHRKDAVANHDYGYVHIGITGKRRKQSNPLTVKRRDGHFACCHSSYLTYEICKDGTIQVVFIPFRNYVDLEYFRKIYDTVSANLKAIEQIFSSRFVSHSYSLVHDSILDTFNDESFNNSECYGTFFFSAPCYFPTNLKRGLRKLICTFAAFYPLLEVFISTAEGKEIKLSERLIQYKTWYFNTEMDNENETVFETKNDDFQILQELDSYSFIRAGLWWDVLARDKWTCRKCGRSVKEHGIVLHVDHEIPRSKGGTNDISNLQALCEKCNLGKSNK